MLAAAPGEVPKLMAEAAVGARVARLVGAGGPDVDRVDLLCSTWPNLPRATAGEIRNEDDVTVAIVLGGVRLHPDLAVAVAGQVLDTVAHELAMVRWEDTATHAALVELVARAAAMVGRDALARSVRRLSAGLPKGRR